MSILDLFGSVDEFWQQFAPWWQQQLLAAGARQRLRPTRLHTQLGTCTGLSFDEHPILLAELAFVIIGVISLRISWGMAGW
jgi:hypothetical protein